jgi:O-antigen ligase
MIERLGKVITLGLLGLSLFWVFTIRIATGIWIGGFTLNAYLTGVAALSAGLLSLLTIILLAQRYLSGGYAFGDIPFSQKLLSMSGIPFLLYSLSSLGLNFRIEGFQNTLTWAAFALTVFALPYWITADDARRIRSTMRITVMVVPLVKIIIFYANIDVYGEASYALVAVGLLAFAVAQRPQAWFDYFSPWLLLFSILLCDVRTAAVVAALLMVVSSWQWPITSRIKTAVTLVISGVVGMMGWWAVGDRLADSGDSGLAQFFGEDSILAGIGTTNRGAAWAHILDNLPEGTNWWGQGAGHSSFLVDELLGIHHPHNEYLRIYFDFGWVGFTLFLAGSLAMFIAVLWHWKRSQSGLTLAGMLSIVVVALMAVTDNPIVFIYVMLPIAVLLSAGSATQSLTSPMEQDLPGRS